MRCTCMLKCCHGVKGYCVKCHFQQYFSYIVTFSFIGGTNQRNQRKPKIYRKSLTNFIT